MDSQHKLEGNPEKNASHYIAESMQQFEKTLTEQERSILADYDLQLATALSLSLATEPIPAPPSDVAPSSPE